MNKQKPIVLWFSYKFTSLVSKPDWMTYIILPCIQSEYSCKEHCLLMWSWHKYTSKIIDIGRGTMSMVKSTSYFDWNRLSGGFQHSKVIHSLEDESWSGINTNSVRNLFPVCGPSIFSSSLMSRPCSVQHSFQMGSGNKTTSAPGVCLPARDEFFLEATVEPGSLIFHSGVL